MPTTMPVADATVIWAGLNDLIGAVVGGLIALLGTWLTLKHQLKAIRLQEIVRLKWTKQWDVVAETYARMAATYLALRAMLNPQGKAEAVSTSKDAWDAWRAFSDYYHQNSLFLPSSFDTRIKELTEEFMVMTCDLSHYGAAKYDHRPQASEEEGFYREFKRKYEQSLADGEMEHKLRTLRDDLRSYLDQQSTK